MSSAIIFIIYIFFVI